MYRQDGAAFDERLLGGILQRLRFRGLDAENIFVERDFASCFSFLEFSPWRQSWRQPVVLDGRYWLIGDARLDGRAELVADVANHGPSSEEGSTGEELLLHAAALGEKRACNASLETSASPSASDKEDVVVGARLCGSPAILLWARRQGFRVQQFPSGVASEFGDLHQSESGSHRRLPAPRAANTVYLEIHRLPPGHLLQFSEAGLAIKRFMVLAAEETLCLKRDEEYLDAHRELLHEVVQDRMPDRSISLTLSGGLDSGTVCALAVRIAGNAVNVTS